MKSKLGWGVLVGILGASGVTYADSAKTLGGLFVQSDDGNYVFSLGGRVHFDYTGIQADDSSHFDSGAAENNGGFYFRRIFISLAGKIYDWRYRIDEDISNANNPGAGLQDAYIARDLGDYGTVRAGQTKPWRSMDELLSNNDKIFTERNVLSANGILGGRDYQLGMFYRINRLNLFSERDNVWAGTSVYSLNKAGATTDQGTGTPTQGIGYNARLAYSPYLSDRAWVHVGASFSSDHADNGARLSAGYSTWYSFKGIAQNVASFSGNQPTTIPSTGKINGGDNPNAVTLLGELAAALGPLYLQAEVGQARLEQDTALVANARNSQTIDAYSVEASYYITGESKKYDPSIASLAASPAPLHNYGAVEIAARYDHIENSDLQIGNTTVCAPAVGTIPAGTTITRCAISSITLGANYYVNRNVRFMLDYSLGKYDLGAAGTDEPGAVNARFQIAF